MTAQTPFRKPVTVNPLKLSQPLGAALAFLGVAGAVPVFHGAKGCASFALVNLVKHFRESIPFQSTALDEIATIMGGGEMVERAALNVRERTGASLVGICTTGLTEVRGEDVAGDLRLAMARRPEMAGFPVVLVSTPDYEGGLQDGWAKAVAAMIEALVPAGGAAIDRQVNVLAGSHLTPGDVEAVRDMVEAFGLLPVILPDLAGSLDGHLPDVFEPVSLGGTDLESLCRMGRSTITLALGEHMLGAARTLQARCGVPYLIFDRLSGLGPTDDFLLALAKLSGRPVPERYRRQRRQLQDALLDGHFYFGGARVVVAGDGDLVWSHAGWLRDMGAEVTVVAAAPSTVLGRLPQGSLRIGDMEDMARVLDDADLLLTNAHGVRAARRVGCPLFRIGYPVFDRLGPQSLVSVGYRGTRDLIFAIGNLLIEHRESAGHEGGTHDRTPTATH